MVLQPCSFGAPSVQADKQGLFGPVAMASAMSAARLDPVGSSWRRPLLGSQKLHPSVGRQTVRTRVGVFMATWGTSVQASGHIAL